MVNVTVLPTQFLKIHKYTVLKTSVMHYNNFETIS